MRNKTFKILSIVLAFLLLLVACGSPKTSTVKENNPVKENVKTQKPESDKPDSGTHKTESEKSETGTHKTESGKPDSGSSKQSNNSKETNLDPNKAYFSKDDVANFLVQFGRLPKNYLTKNQAIDLGWDSAKGNLWKVTDKGVIGGDKFGNREGKLPKNKKYFEADVNYKGSRRNAERLVYTKDGEIYYTKDHYKTFEKIRGR